jgi:hypothetical protein
MDGQNCIPRQERQENDLQTQETQFLDHAGKRIGVDIRQKWDRVGPTNIKVLRESDGHAGSNSMKSWNQNK